MNTTPEHTPGSAMPQSGAVPHHHTSGWTNSTGVDHALDPNIETMPLLEDVFNVMVSQNHRLAGKPTTDLTQLSEERWALDTASPTYSRMITEACQAAGFNPNIVARCKGFEVAIALIREGYAIAILPGLRASYDLEDVWVCRLVPEIRRKISLAFRKGETRSPALKALVTLIQERATHRRFQ